MDGNNENDNVDRQFDENIFCDIRIRHSVISWLWINDGYEIVDRTKRTYWLRIKRFVHFPFREGVYIELNMEIMLW